MKLKKKNNNFISYKMSPLYTLKCIKLFLTVSLENQKIIKYHSKLPNLDYYTLDGIFYPKKNASLYKVLC